MLIGVRELVGPHSLMSALNPYYYYYQPEDNFNYLNSQTAHYDTSALGVRPSRIRHNVNPFF